MRDFKELYKKKGYHLFPCFVDTHIHLISLGLKKLTHDLEEESLQDLLSIPREKLIARGWVERPPQELIDSYDFPVALIRRCGHKAVLNKKAMEILGFEKPEIYEEDVERIYELFQFEDYKKAFQLAEEELFSYGVSYVHSDDLHGLSYNELVDILKNAKIKVYEKLSVKAPKAWMFKKVSPRAEISAIKLYADGSVGARTAFMKKPYKYTQDNGVFLLDDDTLERVFEFGKKHNVEVTVHVIGDGALERLTPYFEKYPGNRIIHAQFIPEELIPKLKNTKFSVQPHFYFEDTQILRFVETDSLKYPFLKLHRQGYDISFSSDAPVSPADPRYVIEHALKMGFSKEEAFLLYTKGSVDTCVYEVPDPINSYPVAIISDTGEILWSR